MNERSRPKRKPEELELGKVQKSIPERGRTAESCHCQHLFGALSSGHRSKPEKIRITRFRTQQQEMQLTETRNLTLGVFVICS